MQVIEWTRWIVLAQGDGGGGDGGGGGLFGSFPMLPAFVGIAFLFYFLLIRPERRKQQAQRDMLAGVKKNDRVVTIGGIKGTVTNISRDDDELTIRVDESSGTRLRMQISAIARVERDEVDEKKKSSEKKTPEKESS